MTSLAYIIISLLVLIILQNIIKLAYLKEIVNHIKTLQRSEETLGQYIHCDYEEVKHRIHNINRELTKLTDKYI